MEPNRRFSLLTFPQWFDGATLSLSVVVLPRNQNPLQPAIEGHGPAIPDAPSFATATLSFTARICTGLASFPHSQLATRSAALITAGAPQAPALFTALAKSFNISNLGQTNKNLDANADAAKNIPAVAEALSVRKYLPVSYRRAFNFTTPRTPNASTDDAYHCAVRDAGKVAGFKRSSDAISWGRVFAFALRQPLLARQLGMIYDTQLDVTAADFPQGGWLYVDLAAGSDYTAQQQADPTFVKRYAARIPPLTPATERQVFAPLLFPVLFKAAPADPDPPRDGHYDQVLIEGADYDDGFAKIVHAYQPHSRNLLAEASDGAHPVKDVGVRLGWDDEQILIWYMRQLAIDPSVVVNLDKRLDAPLGVFGYAVDVRELANPANAWESLNQVETRQALAIASPPDPAVVFAPAGQGLELGHDVYPMQLDGDKSKSYWLPMYFAGWNGHSLVLPDQDAIEIYQTTHPDVVPDPEDPVKDTGTGVSGPARNQLNQIYAPGALATRLRYGHKYEFRVRLRDLSGGGPAPDVDPVHGTPSNTGRSDFKRYVAPNQVRMAGLPVNTDLPAALDQLDLRRPLLGYPAVVYTGQYADPVGRLKAASVAMQGKEAFGIPDPDVDRVEITVEVQTLKMDNLLSVSGRDSYVHLYTTERAFPPVAGDDDYDALLSVPLVYRDCHVLHVGDDLDLATDLQVPGDIDDQAELYVPMGRAIRLSVRAVCADKAENDDYYGLLNAADQGRDVRYGPVVEVQLYRPSTDERGLFLPASPARTLQGIYLQPDAPAVFDGKLVTLLIGKVIEKSPDMLQRLAQQLDVESIGLTLTAAKGERVQFGCSQRIRHTLAPEGSSLTLATLGDLTNHWLCCLSLTVNRDWTWDALEDRSFVITRTVRFTGDDAATETQTAEVGTVELRHTASFEALQDPKRTYTRLLFVDAVEPKNPRRRPPPHAAEPRLPDTIEVSYSVETRFKAGHAAQRDAAVPHGLHLPITTPPAQIPRIASAGLALSPYRRNEKYSATEPRQRYLWVEFEETVHDPQDGFFARVLQYAPDQLISNNQPELFVARPEPALPIDPEPIRVVAPAASNDLAGLNAMQPMQKATDSDRHYLLPLPPGLHADAAEMFGFFTYEFRVGHYRHPDGDMVWSTAQGRFGRPLRAAGVQHPAPTLTCSVNRDEQKLYVAAPYAQAVFNGKNVTADPPRTELWCLLYAQVRQADNQDSRNILLDDRPLDPRVQVEHDPQVDWLARYDDVERETLKRIASKHWKDELSYAHLKHVYKLAETAQVNTDATRYGAVVWSNLEIAQLLKLFGLPDNSPLSVLVVEVLPVITNIYEHVPGLDRPGVTDQLRGTLHMGGLPSDGQIKEKLAQRDRARDFQAGPGPLSDELGHHRILRTSPLTEVPPIC